MTLELKEIQASLGFQALQVRLDIQALRVQKDRKEAKVIMDWTGRQVSEVARARLVPEVRQDLQGLDRKVTKVLLESLGLWDLPARLDQRVYMDFLDLLDHKVHQALKVSVARLGHLGLKVTEDLLDSMELKVKLVTQVSEVPKVILVYKVCKGRLEREDLKDQWVCLELMELKDQEVTWDLPGPLDSEVLLGLQEIRFQRHLGFQDLQEYQGIQDDPAPKVKQVHQEESSMQLAPLLSASQDHLGLLVLPALLDLQDYQVPLALLVCLANLVLKVTEDLGGNREKQEYHRECLRL